MRFLRDNFRKLKYKLKFFKISKDANINYIASAKSNPDLTELMNKYGSDKGGNNDHHNYADYYSLLFNKKRFHIKKLLEVGLGTDDKNMASNMSSLNGKPLASVRAWRDYFPNAQIYGADIDKNILKDEERIKTFYVDQTDPRTIDDLFKNIGATDFDIILEDGLHEFNANICFFENSIEYLSPTGTYIIEDVYYKDQQKFIKYFNKTNYNFSIVDLHHKKNIANNCLIIVNKNAQNI